MGFYGNITNTSNTTFSFDRIYPNRLAMDANANNDGIFVGRYVLVEYDNKATISNIFIDTTNVVKTQQENGVNINYYYGYTTETFNDINTRIQYKPNNRGENKNLNVYFLGEFGQVQKTEGNQLQQEYYTEFYQCVDSIVSKQDSTISYALFKYVTKSNTTDSEYIKNFAIDEAQYKEKKGYDSTVWTKASVKKPSGLLVTEYVRIADLNSVVPTFDLETDAPTMKPLVPHFDADSTNVYYKLHTQPQWGLRVAEVESGKISDSKTNWISSTYNPETGQLIPSDDNGEHDAAIYFNKAAFLPQIDINRNTENGIYKKKEDSQEQNYFTINPTGTSHNQYYLHTALDENGNLQKIYGEANDIQEMRINLPAIGNMMSDAWDIIHGPYRNDDMRQYLTNEEGKMLDKNGNVTEDESKAVKVDSLQGRLNSIAAIEKNQIPIKRINNGQLVGTKINGDKHSIITDNFDASVIKDDFTQDDAWIKTQVNADNTPNAISIHHTFNSTPNSVSQVDKNDNTKNQGGENYKEAYLEDKTNVVEEHQDKIKLYVPYVDAAGHVVGKNIETITLPYGYKKIEVKNSTSKSDAAYTVDHIPTADNTQDTLKLEASNKWIKLSSTDSAEENKVTFGHKYSDFATGTKANTYYGLTQNEDHTKAANNKGDLDKDNTFEVPCLKFDEAGHILEARTHTVTLPEIFKKVVIGNENSNTNNTSHTAGSLEADTMNDNFTIRPGNKWIQMTADANNDAFSIQHYVNKFTETTPTAIDYNSANTKQFSIQAIDWDEAGHLTSSEKTTYTLPDGFKTIAIANSGSSTTTFGTATNASLVAETLTDTATIDTGNRWLTLVADAGNDKVTLSHAKAGTASVSKNLQTNNNTSPNFGASFKVLTAGIDQAGHVKDLSDYSITLPKSSLAEGTTTTTGATSASVVTGIVLENADTGKFTKTTANIGTLTLRGYVLGTDSGSLVETDTINSAMSKLQKQINNEVQARQDAINGLDVTAITPDTAGYVFNAISESNGKVNATATQAVSNLLLTNYNKPTGTVTAIASNDTLNTAFGKLEKKLSDESARIDAILGGVGAAELNTLKEISDALNDDTNYYTTVNNAIATVQNNLNNTNDNITDNYYTKEYVEANYVLKSTYEDLLDRVIALEEKMEYNHPTINPEPETPVEGE